MSAKKQTNQVKISKWAVKYEKLWHKLYYELPRWEQQTIIEEPHGRHATTLARAVAEKAEID